MPYDPFSFFKAGQEIGKSKNAAFSQGTNVVMDAFKERAKNRPTEKDKAMTRYYDTQSDYLTGTGAGASNSLDPNDLESVAQGLGVSAEDLRLEPTVTRFKGKATVTNTPKLKDPLDAKTTDELTQFRSTRENLINNMRLMTPEVKKYMNPLDPRSGRNPIGGFALKAQSAFGDQSANDFLTFKAETDKVFQQFRKATTGAQAALKELGWLEPDYPMPNDTPELYQQKANEAIRRIEQGEELLLDLYSQRGYRVGGMRGGMTANPFMQATRADSAQDATSTPKQITREDALAELRRRGHKV